MKYKNFRFACFSIATIAFIACSKNEEHYYSENFNNRKVYISLVDIQENSINDSITIAKLTGFEKKITDFRGATQKRPFDYENILHINNTWYYTIVPSERYNIHFPSHGIYIATDTLTLGKMKYELQQMVDFNVSNRDDVKVIWTKIDKKKVISLFPSLEGTYIKLVYR